MEDNANIFVNNKGGGDENDVLLLWTSVCAKHYIVGEHTQWSKDIVTLGSWSNTALRIFSPKEVHPPLVENVFAQRKEENNSRF